MALSIGILFTVFEHSFYSLFQFFRSGVLISILFVPIFFIRAIGAGDIKLFIVITCFLGFDKGIKIVIASFLFGGALSIIHLFRKRIFITQMLSLANYFSCMYITKKVVPYSDGRNEKMNCIHFTLPILLGTLFVIGGEIYR